MGLFDNLGDKAKDLGGKAQEFVSKHDVKVYGKQGDNSAELVKKVEEATGKLGLKLDIDHIQDPAKLTAADVKETPALYIDGKLIHDGEIPSVSELVEKIKGKIGL